MNGEYQLKIINIIENFALFHFFLDKHAFCHQSHYYCRFLKESMTLLQSKKKVTSIVKCDLAEINCKH